MISSPPVMNIFPSLAKRPLFFRQWFLGTCVKPLSAQVEKIMFTYLDCFGNPLLSCTIHSGYAVLAGPNLDIMKITKLLQSRYSPCMVKVTYTKEIQTRWFFHPETLGNDPNLTNIFQMGWFNHQLVTSSLRRLVFNSKQQGETEDLPDALALEAQLGRPRVFCEFFFPYEKTTETEEVWLNPKNRPSEPNLRRCLED